MVLSIDPLSLLPAPAVANPISRSLSPCGAGDPVEGAFEHALRHAQASMLRDRNGS
jgi:hypothetical protein